MLWRRVWRCLLHTKACAPCWSRIWEHLRDFIVRPCMCLQYATVLNASDTKWQAESLPYENSHNIISQLTVGLSGKCVNPRCVSQESLMLGRERSLSMEHQLTKRAKGDTPMNYLICGSQQLRLRMIVHSAA
eukprot:6357251-Amphidinium_carterae.1